MAKKKRKKKDKEVEQKPPLNHRLDELRHKIWGAAGIASCMEYASDSMLTPQRGKPNITDTASALNELLWDIDGDLEELVDEHGGSPILGADDE